MGLLYDTANEYMSNAKAAQAKAESAMVNAQGIANSGIQTANSAAAAANGDLSKSSGLISQGVAAYGNMTPYITKVGNAATQVNNTAQTLTPYAAMLKSYADQLEQNSGLLTEYGTGLLGQSTSLMNLDPNAGGLVGQYVGNLASYSPDKYTALAAADVQSSADNAWNQMLRKQSRTGQAANGSGNQAALAKEWARDTAALLAGAKTRAYMTGLNEQTSALRNALADALTMGNAGTSAVSAGNTALSSASSSASGAANVIAQKGNLEATSGQLNASAAGLTAQQAAGYVGAANANTSIANSRISAASLQNSANQQAVSAAIAAAQQQGSFASGWASAATSKDTMDALGIKEGSSSTTQSTYEKNLNNRYYTAGSAHTISNDAIKNIASVG